jgi:hypothetical protein
MKQVGGQAEQRTPVCNADSLSVECGAGTHATHADDETEDVANNGASANVRPNGTTPGRNSDRLEIGSAPSLTDRSGILIASSVHITPSNRIFGQVKLYSDDKDGGAVRQTADN